MLTKLYKMITELLDASLEELLYQQKFEITEFQLGEEPMRLFINECKESMGIPIDANITSVMKYKGINVKEHPSKNAVLYSLKLKLINHEKDSNIVPDGIGRV